MIGSLWLAVALAAAEPEVPAEAEAPAPADEVAPAAAVPVDAAPVEPAPVDATPVEPAPIEAAPVEPAPEEPQPEEPAPTTAASDSTDAQVDEGPVHLGWPEAIAGKSVTPSSSIGRGTWYLGFGLGAGGANLSDEAIGGAGAFVLGVRAGAIVNDTLLFGPEVVWIGQYNAWRDDTHAGSMLSSVLFEVMSFPVADLPLHVSGGAGWGSGITVRRLAPFAGDEEPVAAEGGDGLSYKAAVGWDFGAGEGLNLGVQARYDGTLFVNEDRFPEFHAGTLQFWLNSY